MATITVVAKNIRVYSNCDEVRYCISFDQSFEAIARNADDEYVESEVDYITFVPKVLIGQCCGIIEGLEFLHAKKKEQALRAGTTGGLGVAELNHILRNAIMTLERERFEAGEEYVDADNVIRTHEHAGYRTTIVDIKVTDKVQEKLDAMMDSVFSI